MTDTKFSNRLSLEKSPYLLEHAHNPVDWYPWGRDAFDKARSENKPVFLSIGYSTCHWCHVMARESFEDEQVAGALNKNFVSIKVDREERPDIDNIYMRVCQAFTGGGGWPTSIFMTADQKPFFAGTYYPKDHFLSVLEAIADRWTEDKRSLLKTGNEIATHFGSSDRPGQNPGRAPVEQAVAAFRQSFDSEYGGFGRAPKFPSPHNLLLLLKTAPDMAEKTLLQMYKGGIFDHIGYGFSRYSTDRFWLVPHFEKMLYDNALLTLAYLRSYELTGKELYREVAEKTLKYIRREMTDQEGGFFCAQDADSEGEEGKYYVFTPVELIRLLGEADGKRFNAYFGITEKGNFEHRNIPNLINSEYFDPSIDSLLPKVYSYRKTRTSLRTDHKILTAWNALMIAALADAYRILGAREHLDIALRAVDFIERELTDGDTVYASITDGRRGSVGFLDDYAFYTFALIQMHQATHNERFFNRALSLANKTISEYLDDRDGGFFFSGKNNEQLIFNPKETYDGAMPSGNSVMAYNLSRLAGLTKSDYFYDMQKKQETFMSAEASSYPSGHSFYLYSTLPTKEVVCALERQTEIKELKVKSNWIFQITQDSRYPLLDGKTTFYVCEQGTCLPASNEIPE